MSLTIIESLFDYFNSCPLMTENKLNVDYLPEDTKQAGIEYAIAVSPTDEIITRYLDGGARCRYPFTITSVNDYGPTVFINMENTGYTEKLAEWLRKQSRFRNLPDLPEGMMARSIKALSSGYLYQADIDAGKYQIQCELEYYRKGDR